MAEEQGWHQRHYGKIVTSPDGPIASGAGYAVVAISSNFPKSLADSGKLTELNLGSDDLTVWGDYPWLKSEGGIIFRPIVLDAPQNAWVTAARIRPRSEKGFGLPGRIYTETFAIAKHASEVNKLSLIDFAETLKIQSFTEVDNSLPHIVTQRIQRDVLEEDWYSDVVKNIVVLLLCGIPTSIPSSNPDPEEGNAWLNLFRKCLACLPMTLRWRVSVGIRLFNVDNANVMLGHGAYQPTRPKDPTQEPYFDAALEYVEWLEKIGIDTATSLEQVHTLLDQNAQEFCKWNSIDTRLDWDDVLIEFHGLMQEKLELERLGKWIETSVERRKSKLKIDWEVFDAKQPEVLWRLGQLLDNPTTSTSAMQALESMKRRSKDWQDAWNYVLEQPEGVSPKLKAAAILLGNTKFDAAWLSKHGLSLSIDSEKILPLSLTILTRELKNTDSSNLKPWMRLLMVPDKKSPNWLFVWHQTSRQVIFWQSVGMLLNATDDKSLQTMINADHRLAELQVAILNETHLSRETAHQIAELICRHKDERINEIVERQVERLIRKLYLTSRMAAITIDQALQENFPHARVRLIEVPTTSKLKQSAIVCFNELESYLDGVAEELRSILLDDNEFHVVRFLLIYATELSRKREASRRILAQLDSVLGKYRPIYLAQIMWKKPMHVL